MLVRETRCLFALLFVLVLPLPAASAGAGPDETTTGRPSRAAALAGRLLRAVGDVQTGLASFYHHGLHGLKTASGELYDQTAMTAAHPTLPIGTAIRVTNRKNQRSVIVRINDRGPSFGSRILDLSRAAAVELGMVRGGIAPVKLEVLALAD
jgi:rare lipoprotein A